MCIRDRQGTAKTMIIVKAVNTLQKSFKFITFALHFGYHLLKDKEISGLFFLQHEQVTPSSSHPILPTLSWSTHTSSKSSIRSGCKLETFPCCSRMVLAGRTSRSMSSLVILNDSSSSLV